MNAVLSATGGWAVAIAIAAPIIILFWWARRNAPVGDYQMDYSVSRRTRPPADSAPAMPIAALHGVADAPVPAQPAILASPTETAVLSANTVTLPAQALRPPKPASVLTTAPVKAAEPPAAVVAPVAASPAPVAAAPPAAPEPAKPAPAPVAKATPAPIPTKAPEPAPKPKSEPVAPPAPTMLEAPAPVPTPTPQPASAPIEAPTPTPTPAAAEPAGESDDFARLYGPDAKAIAALHAAGILTYRQLSGASIDSLKEMLSAAGESGVDPSTWPQQGRFAAGGKWKQLDARFKG